MAISLPAPHGDGSLFIRTDFSSDTAWQAVSAAADADVFVDPETPFHARLFVVDDAQYADISVADIVSGVAGEPGHSVVFVVDETTVNDPTYPILAIDTSGDSEATLRVVPSKVWMVENNVNEANVSFVEYAQRAAETPDGVLR